MSETIKMTLKGGNETSRKKSKEVFETKHVPNLVRVVLTERGRNSKFEVVASGMTSSKGLGLNDRRLKRPLLERNGHFYKSVGTETADNNFIALYEKTNSPISIIEW